MPNGRGSCETEHVNKGGFCAGVTGRVATDGTDVEQPLTLQKGSVTLPDDAGAAQLAEQLFCKQVVGLASWVLASTKSFVSVNTQWGVIGRCTYVGLRTAYNCHSPGTPFSSWRPRSAN